MVHIPVTLFWERQAQVRVVWHAVGMATQAWLGELPATPPSVVLQYWVIVWHLLSPHMKQGAGAASIACQWPLVHRSRLQN